jgi:dipeptidyl aminopeptidase/acylaminoacyl peptidase
MIVEGGSHGGFMAAWVSGMYPEHIVDSIVESAILHLPTFLSSGNTSQHGRRRMEWGDWRVPEMARTLEAMSPINYVGRISHPVFLRHGVNEISGENRIHQTMLGHL